MGSVCSIMIEIDHEVRSNVIYSVVYIICNSQGTEETIGIININKNWIIIINEEVSKVREGVCCSERRLKYQRKIMF